MKSKKALQSKTNRFERRRNKVRTVLKSTGSLPRLLVWKSNAHISAQVIDQEGKVLAYATDIAASAKKGKTTSAKLTKTESAFQLGKLIAEKAKEKGVSEVVFDRGGNRYHGRVKSVSEGAREGGLKN